MAWVTGIVDDGQVEYRLTGQAGCYVQHDGEGLAGHARPTVGDQIGSGTDATADGPLVWIGEEGLTEVGQTPGTPLDGAGRQVARTLAKGVHPLTAEHLVRPELRAHPRAKLTGARLAGAVLRRTPGVCRSWSSTTSTAYVSYLPLPASTVHCPDGQWTVPRSLTRQRRHFSSTFTSRRIDN